MRRAYLCSGIVRGILLRRNISQNNLAQRLGISSAYCSQLLAGKRCPSPALRERIQLELHAEFDLLFVIVDEASGV